MFNFSYPEDNSSQKMEYLLLLCRIVKLYTFYLIKIHIHNSEFTYLVFSLFSGFPFGWLFNSSLVSTLEVAIKINLDGQSALSDYL